MTVFVGVEQVEGLVGGEACLFLREHSELLRLNLVLQVRGPRLQKQLSRLGVEDLLLGHHGLRVHRQGCLLGEQACVERILWKEGLAELRVAQLSVIVLVEAGHEKCDLIVSHAQTQLLQAVEEVLDRSTACA